MLATEALIYSHLLLIRATAVQPRLCHRLLALLGDAESACDHFVASEHGSKCGLKYPAALRLQERLRAPALQQQVEMDLAWLAAAGRFFVDWTSVDYPPLLRQIDDPPIGLFCVGDLRIFRASQLAVVGSRHPTQYGRSVVKHLVGQLVDRGLAITSGMALGIDGIAHAACLARGGATIAVLGTGPDQVYPPQHASLYAEIQQQGLIVSEFPPGTTAAPSHFPQRNRVVTGLSLGTLVVEARLKSGSLISARLAMEQGREVFAVPGSVLSKLSEGCHQLLRDGAKLTADEQDVLEELAIESMISAEQTRSKRNDALTPLQTQLLNVLDLEPQAQDRLAELIGVPINEVIRTLVELEILGLIESGLGGYRRVNSW
ncbi:MAG: DNA-protecting protein DprA [SAR86 cluster bacterium]|uniref:DNA-protecting protein DprA n=1 Tax=SAR86 cluster bacterium TaxID=2030880 RepID=A0A972VVK9_9GAMM|nr:DNA-protecting protein DprA [SAR86 cluster bacterium]